MMLHDENIGELAKLRADNRALRGQVRRLRECLQEFRQWAHSDERVAFLDAALNDTTPGTSAT